MAINTSHNSWEGVQQLAELAGAKFPEVVAAQWALESGWGKHFSGKWNAFGLKGPGTKKKTKEVVDGKEITIEAEFLDFEDIADCVDYLVSRWYRNYNEYEGINIARSREEAARELVKQGYATDPEYAEKLIKLMDDHAPKIKEAAGSKVVSNASKPVVRLVAVQDTVLKKEPKQSAALGEGELVSVAKGKSYGVLVLKELAADAHAWVELEHGAGNWFVFLPHWKKEGAAKAAPVTPSSGINWRDFNAKVTPHLTVGEVLQLDHRRAPRPGSGDEQRILRMAAEFEKVRVAWGRPLGVTSFYRPEPINTEVGGVSNSKHITGEAMDIYPVGASLESFYQWLRVRWRGGLGDGRSRGFIHIDLAGGGFVPGAGVRPSRQWTY